MGFVKVVKEKCLVDMNRLCYVFDYVYVVFRVFELGFFFWIYYFLFKNG